MHTGRLAQVRDGKRAFPVHVHLVISDLCNHDCPWCAYRSAGYSSNQLFGDYKPDGSFTNNPNRKLTVEKVEEILTDCSSMGVKAIQFTGGGEPTVHPHLEDFLMMTKQSGMDAALVTNGQLLGRRKLAETVARTCSWVRISIDAGTRETYKRTRNLKGDGIWSLVWDNIEALVALRDRQIGSDRSPYIGLGFVVNKDNYTEIVKFTEKAAKAGVDNIRFSALFQNDGDDYYAEIGAEARHLLQKAEDAHGSDVLISNNFDDRRADLVDGPPDYERCLYQNLTTYIGADMNVYRCCVLAYNKRGIIGSLKNRTFLNLWDEAVLHEFEEFDASACARCMFNNKNRELLKLYEALPGIHENFV